MNDLDKLLYSEITCLQTKKSRPKYARRFSPDQWGDICQSTYESLKTKIERLETLDFGDGDERIARVRGYVHRAVKNKAVSAMRAARDYLPLDKAPLRSRAKLHRFTETVDADAALDCLELGDRVVAALWSFGFSFSEISWIVGQPDWKLRRRWHSILAKMRRRLAVSA